MEYSYLILIPLIAGIGEAIRITGVPNRYIPFINLIIGLALGMILCSTNFKSCIIFGLYTGLGASGLVRSSKEFNNCLNTRSLCERNIREHKDCNKKLNSRSKNSNNIIIDDNDENDD